MLRIVNVVGCRPNFMKIAPLVREMRKYSNIHSTLLHTGQHCNEFMSDVFFRDLELPEPDAFLSIKSYNRKARSRIIREEFGIFLARLKKVDLVVVVGDVDSTYICASAAAKLSIPVAHVEAGLRSYDKTMPEEINRVRTDGISDYLFTPSADADENLRTEGIAADKVYMVGNIMIDTLMAHREKAAAKNIASALSLEKGAYAVLTLHRPSNVDKRKKFENLLDIVKDMQKEIPVVFPMHPRTRKMAQEFKLTKAIALIKGLVAIEPLGYLEFMNLLMNSKFVLTDSGGIQEEATVLGIPCLTLRRNTERPVTVTVGTNTIVGDDKKTVLGEFRRIMDGAYKRGGVPPLWEGKTASRIVNILLEKLPG